MNGKKLLVADDSLTIQKVIRLALSNEGYEIQTVSEGNDALQQIAVFRPDVILVDVSLPGKNAFELKHAINELGEPVHAKFILMSSAFEPVDEAEQERVGFDGRLTKPFDPANLRSVLSGVLKHQLPAADAMPPAPPRATPPQTPRGNSPASDPFASMTLFSHDEDAPPQLIDMSGDFPPMAPRSTPALPPMPRETSTPAFEVELELGPPTLPDPPVPPSHSYPSPPSMSPPPSAPRMYPPFAAPGTFPSPPSTTPPSVPRPGSSASAPPVPPSGPPRSMPFPPPTDTGLSEFTSSFFTPSNNDLPFPSNSEPQTTSSGPTDPGAGPTMDYSDIRHLTESTIRLSGLDDFEWSVSDTGKKTPESTSPVLAQPTERTFSSFERPEYSQRGIQPPSHLADDGDTGFRFGSRPPAPAPESHSDPQAAAAYHMAPDEEGPPVAAPQPALAQSFAQQADSSVMPLSVAEMQEIMRRQMEETLTRMAEKILPEIAERILRQEIRKMLSEQP